MKCLIADYNSYVKIIVGAYPPWICDVSIILAPPKLEV